jgi:integrase
MAIAAILLALPSLVRKLFGGWRGGLDLSQWDRGFESGLLQRSVGRYGHRDALAIRMTARHGFRVSELCDLRWDQVDLRAGLIHVSRKKNGVPSTHPLNGD